MSNTATIIQFPGTQAGLSLEKALEFYLQDRKNENLAEGSLYQLGCKLRPLVSFMRRRGIFTVDRVDHLKLREYFTEEIHGRGLKPGTAANHYSAVRKFFGWLVVLDYLDRNPMDKIPSPKKPKNHFTQYFLPDQVEKLLAACPDNWTGIRTRTIIQILHRSGVRADELCKLDVSSIDFNLMTIHAHGKGNKHRYVPFYDDLVDSLHEWLEVRERFITGMRCEEPLCLFPTRKLNRMTGVMIYQGIKAVGKRAGLQNIRVSPHTFRHTYATEYLAGGGSIEVLQEILGHEDINTTRRYSKVTAQRIRAEYNQVQAKRRLREGRDLFPTKL